MGCDRMEKRDKIGVIVWLCVMLAIAVGIEIRERWMWYLFDDLRQEDVVSMDIILGAYPPFLPPYQVSKADQIQIVECLQQMKMSISVHSSIYPLDMYKDGGVVFWLSVHMKDGSDVVLNISYPDLIRLNQNPQYYRCRNSNLTVQISDICESYVERILAANQTAS